MIRAFRLEGSSMLPVFKPGQVVIADCKTQNEKCEIRPGDCVVYNYGGRRLLHRIKTIGCCGPLLSDDSGRIAPHRVPWRDVEGRVLSRNPLKKGFTGLVYSKARKLFSFSRPLP